MAAQEQSLLNVQSNLAGSIVNVETNLTNAIRHIESNILNKVEEQSVSVNSPYITKLPFGIHINDLLGTYKMCIWLLDSLESKRSESIFNIEDNYSGSLSKANFAGFNKIANDTEPAWNFETSSCLAIWENPTYIAVWYTQFFTTYSFCPELYYKDSVGDAVFLDNLIDEANSDLKLFTFM